MHVVLGSRSLSRGEKAVAEVIASQPSAEGRLDLLELDVTSDKSVAAAAEAVAAKYPEPLFGLCNNAGVGFGKSIPNTLETNFYGTKRVCEAFLPLLDPAEGRICNVASASGPNFVRGLDEAGTTLFTSRSTTWDQLKAELDKYSMGTDFEGKDCAGSQMRLIPPPLDTGVRVPAPTGVAYGLSKAAVNVWTMQLAAANPNLKINSCSPGYILTDLTRGMGATKRPEESNCVRRLVLILASGWSSPNLLLCLSYCFLHSPDRDPPPQHVAPLFLLFGNVPTPATNPGRYYGSDAVRSPIDRYRGPGDPPYEGD